MEYRDTLNLPKTDFPMRANLPVREPERLARWDEIGLYERLQAARKDAAVFMLHDGPPYANGNIHIGHSLNKILKDIVLKFKQLDGYRTPYRPGWDCHGLPIELEVEKKLGRDRKAELGVAGVRAECRKYADTFVAVQRADFQRLGILGEWDRPYLTTDFAYEAAEARELAIVIDSGALYRGRKPVHWCASCRTALAEAEVDHADHKSPSVYVAFPITDATGPLADYADRNPAIAIWTTTPWTLPANLAVCVHPRFTYALVEAGERLLIVAEDMLDGDGGLRETLGLGEVVATFSGSELENMRARHPWIDRDSLIINGDHVTLEAGTGCVHTAPGHGHDDYVVGSRYALDAYAPVNDGGCFTDEVPEFAGQFVFKADPEIVKLLEEKGVLLGSRPIEHSYPHCWRCKKSIIFRATAQWFISMEARDLRKQSLEEIERVEWIPSWGRDRIFGMIENRPDWCLSRQRSWGVPVIAMRCKSCGESSTSRELALHAAELFETKGSDVWFTADANELMPSGFACTSCQSSDLEPETDILDVWFDSGVSYAAVTEADFGEGATADLYLEGSDQHRGWFHSALLASMITRGKAPYKAVLTHGFVLDGDGRKMSKSVGNVMAPQKVIKQYGADILRLWVSAEDYREDVRISGEILKRTADSYRRIRNTARNLIGNLDGFDPAQHVVGYDDLLEFDRWALSRLASFSDRCREAYESYEFHQVYHALNNFCAVDLSALYFDIVKDRIYCSGADSRERRSAQTVMYEILSTLARIIAPVLSFTADEIWQDLTGGEEGEVFVADWPTAPDGWKDETLSLRWDRMWEVRAEVTRALEEKRKAGDIGHSLDSRVHLAVAAADKELLDGFGTEQLADLFIVSQLELVAGESGIAVDVSAPVGAKCVRCWKFSKAVGSHSDHPEICDRCHAVVMGAS
jgi:isoleucyl-tRNA synthetase